MKEIGEHPTKNTFSKWLKSEDDKTRRNPHRKLSEIEVNDSIISQIAEWIKKHHVSEKQLEVSNRKKEILKKYGLDKFIEAQNLFPENENTMKGNFGEIILCEYLEDSTNYKLLVYKLRYNPNISQSMKGDDILLFNQKNIKERIFLGEAKFRIPANKSTVEEILGSFGGRTKLPISLTFISNILRESGKMDLADEVEELQLEMKDGKIPVTNIGFIIGDNYAFQSVDSHHLFGDFRITKETIEGLKSIDDFPIDIIKAFLNTTFKTETDLFGAINKDLLSDKLPKLTAANKQSLFDLVQKSINPNLIFITLSSKNAPVLLSDCYKKAKELVKQELKNGIKKSSTNKE